MRLALRTGWLIGMALGLASVAAGQAAAPARKPVPWKRYCQPNAGFCFKYPGSWTMLGEVFDGNGVVVAPPQKEDRALWYEITLAMVAPSPEGDEEGPGLNDIVEQAAAAMREAVQDFQTLQRQERTVDHQPAQMLKARYRDKATGRDWVEELIFIQGPENEIYSVALKCAPQELARLEPVLKGVLESWTLPQPEPPESDRDEEASPSPSANKPPSKAPHD
ncbi:MAG: hypothetical protein ABSD98_16365 [Candidatus Korobacteraceae bacterium]